MLFSERYKDKIDYGHGQAVDLICGDITYEVKCKLSDVMNHFSEPALIKPDRYNNFTEITDALKQACRVIEEKRGFLAVSDPLCDTFTPYLFDIIELQYYELSDGEKSEFQQAIDKVFQDNDLPWILHDGRMIKIDSFQFEMDLKIKALSMLKELKDAEPVFQSAYTELTSAAEALEKDDYLSVINNAEKSYESILKVILKIDRGNAETLTTQYMDRLLDVPDTMTKQGFKEKVMLSLPFIRNNSGADHGAGSKTVVISKAMARLALNLAATLDTYLIEEYTERISRQE